MGVAVPAMENLRAKRRDIFNAILSLVAELEAQQDSVAARRVLSAARKLDNDIPSWSSNG